MYSAIRVLQIILAAARAELPVTLFTSEGFCDRLRISIGIRAASSATLDRAANTLLRWSDTRRVSRECS
jgi:hypothetical protein